MKSLYEILGVPPDASAAVIKHAFRRLANKNHPDKGGDTEDMQQIQKAYDVLSDPDRRSRYDATGAVDQLPNPEDVLRSEALSLIAQAFEAVLDDLDPDQFDIVSKVTRVLHQHLVETEAKREDFKRKQDRAQRALKRLKTIAGRPDTARQTLDYLVEKWTMAVKDVSRHVARLQEARRLIDNHEYDCENMQQTVPVRLNVGLGDFWTTTQRGV